MAVYERNEAIEKMEKVMNAIRNEKLFLEAFYLLLLDYVIQTTDQLRWKLVRC